MRRRGFTLIELMVAVAIIAILIGLLLPALAILRRQQRMTATRKLMDQIGHAVVLYLDDHARFGPSAADGGDAAVRPWLYLARLPAAAGRPPYLDLGRDWLAKEDGTPAGPMDADVILDAFGDPLGWTIDNDPDAGDRRWTWTEEIELRSSAGTRNGTGDDLVLRFRRGTGRWERVAAP